MRTIGCQFVLCCGGDCGWDDVQDVGMAVMKLSGLVKVLELGEISELVELTALVDISALGVPLYSTSALTLKKQNRSLQ